jgi:hypothetical protein
MNIFRRLITVALMVASTVAWARQSQEPQPLPPDVNITADARPAAATIGDPIRIELTISMPRGFQARLPELKDQVGEFTVLEPHPGPATAPTNAARPAPGGAETDAADHQIRRESFLVAVFRTGSFEFPSLPVTVLDSSGKEYSAASPPVKIEIRSVLTGKDDQLKGLKKQAEIEDPARWIFRLGLVLVLLILALLGWLLWRKRRRPESPRSEMPGLDPYMLAEADLRDLLGRDLLERGFVKQFYVGLSEIVKRVLEAGYRISTSEKTTSEIMEALSQISPASPAGTESARIESFLSGCDLVKFAKYLPSKDENDASVHSALAILETCRRRGTVLVPQAAAAVEEEH